MSIALSPIVFNPSRPIFMHLFIDLHPWERPLPFLFYTLERVKCLAAFEASYRYCIIPGGNPILTHTRFEPQAASVSRSAGPSPCHSNFVTYFPLQYMYKCSMHIYRILNTKSKYNVWCTSRFLGQEVLHSVHRFTKEVPMKNGTVRI